MNLLPRHLREYIMEYMSLTDLVQSQVEVPVRLIQRYMAGDNFDDRTLANILTRDDLKPLLRDYPKMNSTSRQTLARRFLLLHPKQYQDLITAHELNTDSNVGLIIGHFVLEPGNSGYNQMLHLVQRYGDRELFCLLATSVQFNTTYRSINYVIELGNTEVLNRLMAGFYDHTHKYPIILFFSVLRYASNLAMDMLLVPRLYIDVKMTAEVFGSVAKECRYDLITVMARSPYITSDHIEACLEQLKTSLWDYDYGYKCAIYRLIEEPRFREYIATHESEVWFVPSNIQQIPV